MTIKTQRLILLSSENASVRKGYMLNDSNYITLWKRQDYGNRKVSGCQGLERIGWRKDEEMEQRAFLGK